MAFWSHKTDKPTDAPAPPAPPALSEIERLTELIPERDQEEDFLWQPYAGRITQRLDGLPAPERNGKSFVRNCLAAGCEALSVMQETVAWRNKLKDRWDTRAPDALEARGDPRARPGHRQRRPVERADAAQLL